MTAIKSIGELSKWPLTVNPVFNFTSARQRQTTARPRQPGAGRALFILL
jgi:hypothetical protein